MNNNMTDKKRYKLSNEIVSVNDENNINNNNDDRWKMVVQYGILALICVMSFLVAKYIVRSRIDNEKIPIDTSERLQLVYGLIMIQIGMQIFSLLFCYR